LKLRCANNIEVLVPLFQRAEEEKAALVLRKLCGILKSMALRKCVENSSTEKLVAARMNAGSSA
jgi:hypothetical protein